MTQIITEDGKTLKVGDRAFNYYDMQPGEIELIDYDGWFEFRHDNGSKAYLDGSRICSIEFATKKGWI